MATTGRRKSSWILLVLALVVVLGWVLSLLFTGAATSR